MSDYIQENLFSDDLPDKEGMFDAQLSLPLPSMPWARPLDEIVKRDGRREPFDKSKIARAIDQAAQAVGIADSDIAGGVSSAVAIYLSKRLNGQPPTADQVGDAVERVLIQMAHAEIALAYARYRDRRARIRRLRRGDMRALLSELDEARHERESATVMDPSLRVRTSQDSLVEWDRNRIVEALRRETGLSDSLALLIAVEVEQQIQNAGFSALTTPLVRELVGAKLIEHGLIEENELRRRLGVPLYDASRIIRGATPETVGRDPAATDRVLARAVKKEFALTEVFSHQVTQAHLSGELHLHALEFVDRLHSGDHVLACLIAHGLRLSRDTCFAAPPNHPETLLAQMVKFSARLETLFHEGVGWYAVNFMAAPFLQQADDAAMRRFAESLVYECAYRRVVDEEKREPTRISLYWNAPPDIADASALGPTGNGAGQTYKDHEKNARRLALALIEVFASGGVNDANFAAPIIDVILEDAMLHTFEGVHYLREAAAAALRRPGVRFVLNPMKMDAAEANRVLWRPRNVVWQRVALNLPRAAVSVEDEAGFHRQLERLCKLAVAAHKEKRDFIELLLDPTGNAPLAALALEHDGLPYITSEDSLFAVDVDGLFECAQVMIGLRGGSAQERLRFMASTLEKISHSLQAAATAEGMRCVLSANNNPRISRRFATLDVATFPSMAEHIVKTEAGNQALTYTPGIALPDDAAPNPYEAARQEGELHQHLGEQQFTRLVLPLRNTSENALTDLLKKLMGQTACHGITLILPDRDNM